MQRLLKLTETWFFVLQARPCSANADVCVSTDSTATSFLTSFVRMTPDLDLSMIRLLYFSEAVPSTTSGHIRDILESSRQSNKAKNITGVLVAGGNVFLQILEGPTQAVLSLYLKIAQDPRHCEVEIMRVTPIVQRLFADWSMEYYETTKLQFLQVVQFKTDYFAFEEPLEFTAAMRGMIKVLQAKK